LAIEKLFTVLPPLFYYNTFFRFSQPPEGKGNRTTGCGKPSQVQLEEGIVRHFESLLPTDSAVFSFGRVHASLSLLGSKSATDESIEVFVLAGLAGRPIELAVDPFGAANSAVSVEHRSVSP
jgi:hypothetical protein